MATPRNQAVIAPVLRADGSCPACSGGWVCAFHRSQGLRADRERSAMLRRVCAGIRANRIAEVCARFELESDEGGTREEKAARMLAAS